MVNINLKYKVTSPTATKLKCGCNNSIKPKPCKQLKAVKFYSKPEDD
jgi:hypothetical protein